MGEGPKGFTMTERRRDHGYSPIIRGAFVHLGSGVPLLHCDVLNISAGGARLVCKSQTLPQRFVLFLTPDGRDRRSCTVVWRDADETGVSFEGL